MSTPFGSLEHMIANAAEAIRPAQRMTVSEAAEKYRYINNPGAYVGPWLNKTTPYLVEPMDVLSSWKFTGMAFAGPAQCGKALALDTVIPTPSGWVMMGDLEVGDCVIGSNGRPCRVTAATPVQYGRACFEVIFRNGERVVADAGHNWAVFPTRAGLRDAPLPVVKKTSEILESNRSFSIPRFGYSFPEIDLPLDPYVLGAWLGDGHKYGARIYSHVDDVSAMRGALGIPTRFHVDSKGLGVIALSEKRHTPGRKGGRAGVSRALEKIGMGAGETKRIPIQYQRAGDPQRLALLQGLLDTDGHATTRGHIEFSTSCAELARDFRHLCFGLGYSPRECFKNGSILFRFAPHGDERLFRFERKQVRLKTGKKRRPIRSFRVAIDTITEVPSVPVRCISVDDPGHLYMFGTRGNLTHNTDMFPNWLGHSTICDPADMMLIQTSQTTARDFSMRRIDRLHRHSPDIGARLLKTKQADNTYDKTYRSGMLLTLSWPTINELSGKPIPRLWLTDYDRMTQDVDGEGSPFFLARKRATTFRSNGMCAAESSPGFVVDNPKWIRTSKHEAPPTQGILAIYNQGDRRRWYWQCVSCHNHFEPSFDLIRYPESEDLMEAAEMATLECPHCSIHYHHDPMDDLPGKHLLNERGLWVPDHCHVDQDGVVHGNPPRSTIASFWLKGVAAAFSDWKTLVFNHLSATREYNRTGNEETLKATVNTDQGEPYAPKSLSSDRVPEALKARAKDRGFRVVPATVRFLIATIDIQKNRFVVQVHGITATRDIVVIDRFDVRKSEREDKVAGGNLWVNPGAYLEDWKLLVKEVMLKTYPLSDGSGREMGMKFTVSDSGGREGVTANAYSFYRWLRYGDPENQAEDAEEGDYEWSPGLAGKFLLLKGASAKEAPRVAINYPDSQRKDRSAGARGEIPVLMINPNLVKDMLDHMLNRTDPGGQIEFPNWLDDNFFIELTVEVKNPQKNVWENPHKFRNESWDLLAYCIAATLTPMIGLEHMNFDDAPPWAEVWDMNDLVFDPETQDKPYEAKRSGKADLAALAENLA